MQNTDFLYRDNMINQCAATIAILEKDNENLAKLDEALLAFAEDTQLFSTKIDYAKAHFNDYHLICGMLQEANNCDIDAFRKVSDIISTDIKEDLCGDIIHETKRNAGLFLGRGKEKPYQRGTKGYVERYDGCWRKIR